MRDWRTEGNEKLRCRFLDLSIRYLVLARWTADSHFARQVVGSGRGIYMARFGFMVLNVAVYVTDISILLSYYLTITVIEHRGS